MSSKPTATKPPEWRRWISKSFDEVHAALMVHRVARRRWRCLCEGLMSGGKRCGGVGLAEVVICLAIIAVFAAYAMPSYRTQLMRAYRADAVAALYRAAHYVEQQQMDAVPGAIVTLPVGLAQAPQSGQAIYALTLGAADADADTGGYALEARPLDDGPMGADSVCGAFVLDADGLRANRVDGTVSRERVDTCWDGRRHLP